MIFPVDSDGGVQIGPGEDLGYLFGFHIDTAVGHDNAKIFVPVGAVQAIAELFWITIVVEKKNVGDIG